MPRSPIQFSQLSPEARKYLIEGKFLERSLSRLTDISNSIEQTMEKVRDLIDESNKISERVEKQLARVDKLPKGEKGDRGEPGIGYRGPAGKDGKDGKDGVSPDVDQVALKAVLLLKRPRDGRDGRDAVIDQEALVRRVIEALKDSKSFDWRKIPGLENEISSYRNQLAGKRYGKDTWARGGGTTVSAGTNITLTPLSDGTVRIDAAGGTSGSNVETQYNVTAVQSGDNITIDLTQLTNWADFIAITQFTRNNMPQTEGASFNFTVAGSTLTGYNMDASDIFNISYSYA